jgi:conjugative transfer signal peptidase TraF
MTRPTDTSRNARWEGEGKAERSRFSLRHFGRRPVALRLGVVAGGVGLWALLYAWAGLGVNLSPSAPAGLYRSMAGAPSVGDYVRACLPLEAARLALERGYVGRGPCPGGAGHVVKRLAAAGGDTVSVTRRAVSAYGRRLPRSRPRTRDRQGRPLTPALGRHVLSPGEVWLHGDGPGPSYDGRYFGPVPQARVEGRLELLWRF